MTADGPRNITGAVNGDGTVTIHGVTATFDNVTNMDAGADPNEVLMITGTLANTTLARASGEDFAVFGNDGPTNGTVFRGIGDAPVPEPASLSVFCLAVAGRRRRAARA